MAKKMCTPFCDTKKTCPRHHDLLLAVINCSDRKDKDANACFEELQSTVKAYRKKGWNIDDVIPDPVRNYRFPLLHWAGVLGKARAMEWMINFGFDVAVRTLDSNETALHRSVLCLHFSNTRRFSEKIKRMVHMLKDCLCMQDKAQQTPLHAAAVKLITGTKSDYYSEFLHAMVAKAMEIPGKTTEILNARDQHGNTALHYLAQNEIGLVPVCSIIKAGGDISIVNKMKRTALDIALNYGSTRIIKSLNSAGKKSKSSCCYDDDIYTADSPPESPLNLEQNEEDEHEIHNDDLSHGTHVANLPDHAYSRNTSTPALECSGHCSFSTKDSKDVPKDASNGVCLAIAGATCSAENFASSCAYGDAASAATNVVLPGINDEALPAACSELSCHDQVDATLEITGDALSVNADEAGPSCDAGGTHSPELCRCSGIGVQTPVINPYSCIVHIKQEKLSPCENCQQESSMGDISSSSETQSITTTELANSVISLLRGAGLLDNLTEIAEKKRTQDEHVLTDKLEMVKETNSALESSCNEIEENNSRIARLSAELQELKQQVQTKVDDRERLLRKRKLLNDECTTLQKKLHCCDSLLKVVPKVNLDSSNA